MNVFCKKGRGGQAAAEMDEAGIEAAARMLLAGRCKRAGMHRRLENAVAVASIIAMLRSAA